MPRESGVYCLLNAIMYLGFFVLRVTIKNIISLVPY